MKKFISFCGVLLAASTAQAQSCTENALDGFNVVLGYGSGGNGRTIGQQFTACADGAVCAITIDEDLGSTFEDYTLWIDVDPGVGVGNGFLTASPAWEVIPNSGAAYPRTTTLSLATPFPVTNGTVYRFVLDKPGGVIDIRCSSPEDYLGGEASDDSGTYAPFDLNFTVDIGPTATLFTNNGTGLNLDVQSAPPAVLNSPWSATVTVLDPVHPPTGILVLLFNPVSLAAGPQINLGAGLTELLIGPAPLVQPCPPFQTYTGGTGVACPGVVIPNDLALLGTDWCTQVAVGSPGTGYKFTNSVCGTVGLF